MRRRIQELKENYLKNCYLESERLFEADKNSLNETITKEQVLRGIKNTSVGKFSKYIKNYENSIEDVLGFSLSYIIQKSLNEVISLGDGVLNFADMNPNQFKKFLKNFFFSYVKLINRREYRDKELLFGLFNPLVVENNEEEFEFLKELFTNILK